MPGFTKAKKKKQTRRELKLPTGRVKLQPAEREASHRVDEKVEKFCDDLMQSEWRPYISRPRQPEMLGFFVIMRWYVQEKTWVVLYVGKGIVRHELEQIFNGHAKNAISHYMSCFPKGTRNLIWLKWLPDPFYPYEGLDLKDVLSVVAARYNCNEIPAFNVEYANLTPRDELPEDFSIIPDWNKKKGKKRVN